MLVALAILAILAVVVWVVSAPLRRGADVAEAVHARELEELEVEKETKYAEIRGAEMDRRTGKLDDADWREVDRQLRAEAVAILLEIDRLGGDAQDPDR